MPDIYDLILRGGRVIDPSQDINRVLDVGVRDGIIAGLGESLSAAPGTTEIDVSDKYVCPGLIDLHGHFDECSSFGIDPNLCLNFGVTTAADAGTTGFINFPEFRRNRMETARVRLLAFVNIAGWGIPTVLVGELEDLRMARPKETIAILEEHADVTLGVKIREGSMTANHGYEALTLALEAAQSTRLPLMVHISKGADTPNILRRLRPGDILTHCFQGRGDGLLVDGALIPEVHDARSNGITFDVGHGAGSFNWDVAKRAFEHSFYPDTISTDLHRFSIERLAQSMPVTMSKFLHLGMSVSDVILKSTWAPAKAIRRDHELGTMKVGRVADLFVFEMEEGEFRLEDTHGKVETAKRRIRSHLTLKSGAVIPTGSQPYSLRRLRDCDREIFGALEEPVAPVSS